MHIILFLIARLVELKIPEFERIDLNECSIDLSMNRFFFVYVCGLLRIYVVISQHPCSHKITF